MAKKTPPRDAPAKAAHGKAPASSFQSYKDLDFNALFGEFQRRIGEHRQAEDLVIGELREKFQVIYYLPVPKFRVISLRSLGTFTLFLTFFFDK
jgi:hypothetical protein